MSRRAAVGAIALALLSWTGAPASSQQQPLSATVGSFARSNAPIDIQADQLIINDAKKTAIYRGNVIAVQGDYKIQTVELEVFYASKDAKSAGGKGQPGAPGRAVGEASQQITRILAKEKVMMTSAKDQTAFGDQADYNVAEQKIVLTGREVFLKQGENVLRGQKLIVELATGETRFEAADPALRGSPAPAGGTAPGACPPGRVCSIIVPQPKDPAKPGGPGEKTKVPEKGASALPPAAPAMAPAGQPKASTSSWPTTSAPER